MTGTAHTPASLRGIGGIAAGTIGLGAMPLSVEGRPDEGQALATIHAALDAGVRLIDTADCPTPPSTPSPAPTASARNRSAWPDIRPSHRP